MLRVRKCVAKQRNGKTMGKIKRRDIKSNLQNQKFNMSANTTGHVEAYNTSGHHEYATNKMHSIK